MKSVLISIQPQWCDLIASGKKTLEIRKTRPKLETPFKCYIYCSGTVRKVIGEFICDGIYRYSTFEDVEGDEITTEEILDTSCVPPRELRNYESRTEFRRVGLRCWHITDLAIYDKPIALSEFTGLRHTKFGYEPVRIERAPQSWCYVEES